MYLLYFYINLVIICSIEFCESFKNFISVGCHEENDVSGFKNINSNIFKRERTATVCVSECQSKSIRFAGVMNGNICMCGEHFSGSSTNGCTIRCAGNSNENCGGLSMMKIFDTAGGALGVPQGLNFIGNTETSIHISWRPPAYDLDKVDGYFVIASPLFYFNEQRHPQDKDFRYSALTQTAVLDGLSPGTKYNISVSAISSKGNGYYSSLESWTRVGNPDKPTPPKILTRTSSTITVELEAVIPSGGPISFYQIVVIDETIPVVFEAFKLTNHENSTQYGIPFYIAAEISYYNFDTVFTVGDGKYYGTYFNAPLKENTDYHIVLGVLSTINETRSSYSESDHSQHQSYRPGQNREKQSTRGSMHMSSKKLDSSSSEDPSTNDGLILALSIAVGLFAFLLIASILIYFSLRVYFKRNTRRMIDHQELAVHAQLPNQDLENGFVVGAHFLEDEEAPPDYYRVLREKVKIFPHQHINVVADLGIGKFGDIKKVRLCTSYGTSYPESMVYCTHIYC